MVDFSAEEKVIIDMYDLAIIKEKQEEKKKILSWYERYNLRQKYLTSSRCIIVLFCLIILCSILTISASIVF